MQKTLPNASGAGAEWLRCRSADFFLTVASAQARPQTSAALWKNTCGRGRGGEAERRGSKGAGAAPT